MFFIFIFIESYYAWATHTEHIQWKRSKGKGFFFLTPVAKQTKLKDKLKWTDT